MESESAKARRDEIKNFTGVADPYEAPEHSELKLDAANELPKNNARLILDHLIEKGFVKRD
jgi:adenylylsulfate kinase-like enzyme